MRKPIVKSITVEMDNETDCSVTFKIDTSDGIKYGYIPYEYKVNEDYFDIVTRVYSCTLYDIMDEIGLDYRLYDLDNITCKDIGG